MKKEIVVVTAMIAEIGGLYFISQRPLDTSLAGKWEFPGGKLQFGETLEKCIKREIKQELGIRVKEAKEVFAVSYAMHDEGKRQIILIALRCRLSSNNVKTGVRHAWVRPVDMQGYDFCEADLSFVKKLQNGDLCSGGAISQ
ncbi:MAG: NUDIX domain-containing protein [bacterium]|nr:NUDIX domain-containing protein [bacterium]